LDLPDSDITNFSSNIRAKAPQLFRARKEAQEATTGGQVRLYGRSYGIGFLIPRFPQK